MNGSLGQFITSHSECVDYRETNVGEPADVWLEDNRRNTRKDYSIGDQISLPRGQG
jgi:hypothetical protein